MFVYYTIVILLHDNLICSSKKSKYDIYPNAYKNYREKAILKIWILPDYFMHWQNNKMTKKVFEKLTKICI